MIRFFICLEYKLYDTEQTKLICKIPDLIEYCTKTKPVDFYKIITESSTAATEHQKLKVYQQFANCCVQHVVGKLKMSRMGKNLSDNDRMKYEKTITITDEAFAILILEDRWTLWNQIYMKRKANHHQLLLGDEDDQRAENEKREKTGPNLTVYSYYGTMAPNFKGFDPNVASNRLNEIHGFISEFRAKVEGKRVLKKIGEYCGDEVKQGPKSKKEREDRSTVPMSERQPEVNDFSSEDEDDGVVA